MEALANSQQAYREAVERLRLIAPDLAKTLPAPADLISEIPPIQPAEHPSKTRGSSKRGGGRIFQRGGQFWIAYYAPKGGKSTEHREPGGATEKEARRKLKDRLEEIIVARRGGQRFQGPRQERIMVDELLQSLEQDYVIHGRKSLPQLRSHLGHIRNFFVMDRALAITPDRLRLYIASRQEEGAQPATINRELEGLRRAFALAVEAQSLATIPIFPSLPEDNARQGFFEHADFEAVRNQLRDRDVQDFCDWFFKTGMRPGEIRALTWAAFDLETWTLRLHARDAKIRRGRVIPLEGDIRSIIERRIKARRLDCPLIFHRNGKPFGDFSKAWKRACRVAGLSGKLIYDLRRTAVRNMVRAGVDPAVAMKISGHRTRNIFDRYNIVDEADIRQAVLKTDAYVQTLPKTSSVIPLRTESVG